MEAIIARANKLFIIIACYAMGEREDSVIVLVDREMDRETWDKGKGEYLREIRDRIGIDVTKFLV